MKYQLVEKRRHVKAAEIGKVIEISSNSSLNRIRTHTRSTSFKIQAQSLPSITLPLPFSTTAQNKQPLLRVMWEREHWTTNEESESRRRIQQTCHHLMYYNWAQRLLPLEDFLYICTMSRERGRYSVKDESGSEEGNRLGLFKPSSSILMKQSLSKQLFTSTGPPCIANGERERERESAQKDWWV